MLTVVHDLNGPLFLVQVDDDSFINMPRLAKLFRKRTFHKKVPKSNLNHTQPLSLDCQPDGFNVNQLFFINTTIDFTHKAKKGLKFAEKVSTYYIRFYE